MSLVVHLTDDSEQAWDELRDTIDSFGEQDSSRPHIIIIHGERDTSMAAKLQFENLDKGGTNTTLVMGSGSEPRDFSNALAQVHTELFAYILPGRRIPQLRKSFCLQAQWAALRNKEATMFYFDFQKRATDGRLVDIRLQPHHKGCLRDNHDFGRVLVLRAAAVRALEKTYEDLPAVWQYDMRLRLSEQGPLIHIASPAGCGSYEEIEDPEPYDIFAYLRRDDSADSQSAKALSGHLRRIGAYVESGTMRTNSIDSRAQIDSEFKASIVIPAYQRPEFIHSAIESAIGQTEKRTEIIVIVNGGDSDPTTSEVRKYLPGGIKHRSRMPEVKLIVIDINNLGLSLNIAVAAARSPIYIRLDSDDLLMPHCVEKILETFERRPDAAMVIGTHKLAQQGPDGILQPFDGIDVVRHPHNSEGEGVNNVLRINGVGAPRAAKISAIKSVGWYNLNDSNRCRNYGEDYDILLRIAENYPIVRIWDPIYVVVRHNSNTDSAITPETALDHDESKDSMRHEAIMRRIHSNRNHAEFLHSSGPNT